VPFLIHLKRAGFVPGLQTMHTINLRALACHACHSALRRLERMRHIAFAGLMTAVVFIFLPELLPDGAALPLHIVAASGGLAFVVLIAMVVSENRRLRKEFVAQDLLGNVAEALGEPPGIIGFEQIGLFTRIPTNRPVVDVDDQLALQQMRHR
jgi:hypothetical protein